MYTFKTWICHDIMINYVYHILLDTGIWGIQIWIVNYRRGHQRLHNHKSKCMALQAHGPFSEVESNRLSDDTPFGNKIQ